MKKSKKLLLPLMTLIIGNNLLFAQGMASVEDRSISVDSEQARPINPQQPVSSFEEFDTPVQNPNEIPNLVTQPVYEQGSNLSTRAPRTASRMQMPTDEISDNQSSPLNEEMRMLEQEIESDNIPSKRKSMDLQSLSSDARLQRLENVYEQQQNLKLEKKIRLLQLQLQALTGALEAQQHKWQQLQSQDKLTHESLERRLSELSSKAESQSSQLISHVTNNNTAVAPTSAKVSNSNKGFDSPETSQPVVQSKPIETKKSYTLKDSEAEQQALYNAAYEQIKARKYDQAIQKFSQYIAKYPQGQFAEGSNYWLGEIYMLQSKYDKALTAFDQVVTKYPKGQKSADALYKKGLLYLYKKDFNQAKATLSNVIKKYANSEAAGLAAKQLKTIESINNAA